MIKKAFVLNGQLDLEQKLVPSLENCINTYRGNICGSYLENKKECLIEDLYEEVYTNGMVRKQAFDEMSVPYDVDSSGLVKSRNFGINNENRQRSKCLSSTKQIEERSMDIHVKKHGHYLKDLKLYEAENNEYELNKICESKLVAIVNEPVATNQGDTFNSSVVSINENESEGQVDGSFASLCGKVSSAMIINYRGKVKITKNEMKAFVRVRSGRKVTAAKITYLQIPDKKLDLQNKMVDLCNNGVVNERVYTNKPTSPVMK